MLRHRIRDAELMPPPAHGEDRVEAAEVCIKAHAAIVPRNRCCGYPGVAIPRVFLPARARRPSAEECDGIQRAGGQEI